MFKKIQKYFIDSLSYMALGLFASLIISLIIKQFSLIPFLNFLNKDIAINIGTTGTNKIVNIYKIISSDYVVGAAIGASIAYGLKKHPLVIFSACAGGALGYLFGGPLGSYISTLVCVEIGQLVSKKTFMDIVITPFVCIVSSALVSLLIGQAITSFMDSISSFIKYSTSVQPFLMGLFISVIIGMALTAPISSAAICIMLNIDGLAAGAAAIGCCTQMVGFAIMSYKDNKWNGVFSVGVGTSMLQFGNIVKKPLIWLPTIIVSAILGPISTMLFKMENTSLGAGMGTSGLVGLFGAFEAMEPKNFVLFLKIVGFNMLLPGILVFGVYLLFLKFNWIKEGDMIINTMDKKEKNLKLESNITH